jgi:hypothetical protein
VKEQIVSDRRKPACRQAAGRLEGKCWMEYISAGKHMQSANKKRNASTFIEAFAKSQNLFQKQPRQKMAELLLTPKKSFEE